MRVVDETGIREFIDRPGSAGVSDPAVDMTAGLPVAADGDALRELRGSDGETCGPTGGVRDPRRTGRLGPGPSPRHGVPRLLLPGSAVASVGAATDHDDRRTCDLLQSPGHPVVVFAHSNLAQFRTLHEYLNRSGLATSYLLCSENNYRRHREAIPNLVPFQPHGGKLKSDDSFYYLTRVEGANRRSLGLLKSIQTLQSRTRIDLFVGHVTAGSPSLLFGEVDFPIVTYLEYPSFHAHGWDAQYPPPDIKIRRDRNFEMLTWYSVLRSDHALVPSEYARKLFPEALQSKISVLMEGFDLAQWDAAPPDAAQRKTNSIPVLDSAGGYPVVGFAARDLSSAKGFEQFVRIANRIAQVRPDVRFVVLGSAEKLLYSYENHFLEDTYGAGNSPSFRDYVLEKHGAERWRFTFPGLLPYEEFARVVSRIDLFLYPLQSGSANWGLYELLGRGRIVIGSNRCFVPEAITDGVNGFLCDYDNIEDWVSRAIEILDDPAAYRSIGDTARRICRRNSIESVADEFLRLREQVWTQH